MGEGKLQRRREGMISTDFRLWAKVQEGRGSPCMLRNLIAMGAQSELNVSGGEHQHICRVGLFSSGIQGPTQRLPGLGDM